MGLLPLLYVAQEAGRKETDGIELIAESASDAPLSLQGQGCVALVISQWAMEVCCGARYSRGGGRW
jgi:hypothetical protein